MWHALLLIVLLFIPGMGWATPSCDTASNNTTESDPQTVSYTVGTTSTTNRVVLAVVAWRSEGLTVNGVTYNGGAMTELESGASVTAVNPDIGIKLYYQTGISSGTFDVTADYSGVATQSTVLVLTCYDVNQTTPFRNNNAETNTTNGGTSVSITIPSAVGDLPIDFVSVGSIDSGDPIIGADQFVLTANIQNGVANHDLSSSYEVGAASNTMSWSAGTSEVWAQIGGSLMPPASSRRVAPIILP